MPNMSVYPFTYTYGEGVPELCVIYVPSEYGSAPFSNFYGWYTDLTFTTQVYSISPRQAGDVIVYAKYDYWIESTFADYTSTVAGTGINKQPHFEAYVMMGSYYFERIQGTSLSKIKIVVKFDYWEINDGYQELYLYNGSKKIWSKTLEHSPGGKSTTPKAYNGVIELDISDYKDVEYFAEKEFLGAHAKSATVRFEEIK